MNCGAVSSTPLQRGGDENPTPVLSIRAERINGARGKKIGGNVRWNDIIDTKTCSSRHMKDWSILMLDIT